MKRERFELSGKVALVCGGGGAIGSAVAVGLAEHGADVAIGDVDGAMAAAAAERVRATGRRSASFAFDMTSEEQVDAAVANAAETLGGIDVLVNVAGSGIGRPVLDMQRQEWDRLLSLYLTSVFLTCRAAGRRMVAQGRGGSVVNVSSISSVVALGRGTAGYAAAKAGLNALTRELAVEWAPHNVRVNGIAPCQFRTPSLERVLDDPALGGRAFVTERMLSNIVLGRFGEPEDLVGPCVFLASGASAMVTGHLLMVDGGYTLR